MGSEVSETAFTSDQGITYNMAAHMMGLELSAALYYGSHLRNCWTLCRQARRELSSNMDVLQHIKQRTWGVRGRESYSEWGQGSPTRFRMRRTRITASRALPKPSVIR